MVLFICSLAVLYFMDKTYFLCPIKYSADMIIRSDARGSGFFGEHRNGNRKHAGLDLYAEVGTPVFASRLGRVIAARYIRGMGNYVFIQHLGGITTLYGHLSEFYVKKGQFVRQGQIIGKTGKTGNANYRDIQPHLHLEVKKNGIPQDPLDYLRNF